MKKNNSYEISQSTLALVNAKDIVYQTIIYDVNGTYVTKQMINQLINDACLKANTTYQAKREISRRKFGQRAKPQIIIDATDGLYLVPTMSPKSYDCMYLFPEHIAEISNDKTPIVTFKNGLTLPINCSKSSLKRQIERAKVQMYDHIPKVWMIMERYNKRSPWWDLYDPHK